MHMPMLMHGFPWKVCGLVFLSGLFLCVAKKKKQKEEEKLLFTFGGLFLVSSHCALLGL